MGWLPPWCPNLSLKVVPPRAWPRIWCPMQIPKSGFLPSSIFTFSTISGTADGSPCAQRHLRGSATSAVYEMRCGRSCAEQAHCGGGKRAGYRVGPISGRNASFEQVLDREMIEVAKSVVQMIQDMSCLDLASETLPITSVLEWDCNHVAITLVSVSNREYRDSSYIPHPTS